jgi:F0F1-type ATP synthase membrane subunit c/vacuolar-type H+-ATPase subunit K
LSILVVGVVLLVAFGEGLNLSHFSARELVLFLFFPFGVCLGMALAWRWEGLGGGITVGSFAAFYLVQRFTSSSFPKGFAFVALAAPGFLFLLCWLWTRSTTKQHGF